MNPETTRHDAPADTGSGEVAATSHTITRRTALAAIGSGVAVAGVLGVALAVVESHPDAELIALGRHRAEALAEAERLTRELTRIGDSLPGDLGPLVSVVTARDFRDQAKAYHAFTEAEIADHVATLAKTWPEGSQQHAEALASTDKLITELRQKKAASKAELDRRGYAQVESAADAAWKRLDEIEDRILSTPARTIAGLAVKLELALHRSQDSDLIGRPFNDQDWDTKAIWRTLDDARRMAGRAS